MILRAVFRMVVFALALLLGLALLFVANITGRQRLIRQTRRLVYKTACWIANMQVRVEGQLAAQRPLLLVSNHCSYMDIFALGSIYPFAFAAKSEMSGWPVIGIMCRLFGVIFIERKVTRVHDNSNDLRVVLRRGEAACVFPEGTTSDGKRVQAFKSSFFSLAEERYQDQPLLVQPASVVYTRVRGLPIEIAQLPVIAWYGDMLLLPHFFRLLQLPFFEVVVTFHPPVTLAPYGDRKKLATYCEETIRGDVQGRRLKFQ